jgi:hypothetical protein
MSDFLTKVKASATSVYSGGTLPWLGLFLIPSVVALVQCWASLRIIMELVPYTFAEGAYYVAQAQAVSLPFRLPKYLLHYGLYPAFLSYFRLPNLDDWSMAGIHPDVIRICVAQSVVLALSTAIFLGSVFKLSSGSSPMKFFALFVCSGVLLSPLVIVWPRFIFTESLTISAIMLLVCSCLAYDTDRRHALLFVGLSCCIVILVREPTIFFVWIFIGLLGLNILLARKKTQGLRIAAIALLLAVSIGLAKTSIVAAAGKYTQTLVNVIQFRMLPDEERRTFFIARGLPTSPEVMRLAGKTAWDNGTLFLPDEEVSPDYLQYRNWISSSGLSAYAVFLMTHPGYLVQTIFVSPNFGIFGGDFRFAPIDLWSIPMRGYSVDLTPYPAALRDFMLAPLAPFGPVAWLVPLILIVIVTVRYLIALLRRELASSIDMLAIAACASILISYHADAWDLWRHTIPFLILTYLCLGIRVGNIFTVRNYGRLGRRKLKT